MKVYYNSRDEYYKKPFGAVEVGTTVTFKIRVSDHIKALKCYIAMWRQDERLPDLEMERDEELPNGDVIYKAIFKTPKDPAVIWYHFVLESFDEKYFYSISDNRSGGEGVLVDNSPRSYQLTVYEKDSTPAWFKEGIAYQIFPDRFNRGSDYEERKNSVIAKSEGKDSGKVFVDDWNKTPRYDRTGSGEVNNYDFFGGTLKGIEEKLEYLKSLNVTLIYLNPIFEARSNHRYDTGDYKKIDTLLGDEKSFESLIKSAKKLGIGIVLDGVFSHQGADSIYFNKYNNYDSVGAYNSKESKYYDWYSFEKWPDKYECWWGVTDLPNVKEMNKTYLDYICKSHDSVIKHWMKKGIAGFRLDVADELPDEFIVEIRHAMDNVDRDNILIGEVWEDATTKVSYDKNRKYFINSSLKSVMNYPFLETSVSFMKGFISSCELEEFFYKQMENYPKEYYYSNLNLLDSHDRVRILTLLADSRDVSEIDDDAKYNHGIDRDKYLLAVSRLKALTVLQYTVPGIPMIYYGDEVGVYGYNDPYNRKTYPWGMEDKGLYAHYEVLGKMRAKSEILRKGDFKPLYAGTHTFVFERSYKGKKVIIAVNRGIFYNEGEHIEIEVKGDKAVSLIGDETIDIKDGRLIIDMLPLGYKVLEIK